MNELYQATAALGLSLAITMAWLVVVGALLTVGLYLALVTLPAIAARRGRDRQPRP